MRQSHEKLGGFLGYAEKPMENEVTVEPLPATTEQSDAGMEGNVSQSQYAAQLVEKAMAKAAAVKTEAASEAKPADTIEEDNEVEQSTDKPTEVAEEGDKTEGDEQPEEQPDTEEEPVLSKLDPKTQEKIQKRIGKVTARAKTAEERASNAEAKIAELEAKLSSAPTETEQAPVVVPTDDPTDRTATAKSEDELAKLEQEAQVAIDFVEANHKAITRAIAKDEEVVVIGGREFKADDLLDYSREAKRHIERLIPQRRTFLKERATATSEAKTILPGLFDKSTAEYQEFASFQRKYPAIRSVPGAERLFALAKIGEKAMADQKAKATVPTKKASAVAPKAGADTGAAASAAKPRGNASGEVGQLKVQLGQAEKRFEASRSQSDYQQVLILQSRLKKIT